MALFLLPGLNKAIKSRITPYSSDCHGFIIATLEITCLHIQIIFFLAVTKSKEVEICMVKHWRVDREEKYEIVEKWFLKDLEMIDGKEADTVSVTLCMGYKY